MNQGFRLSFKPKKVDYKGAANIKQQKRLARLERENIK